MVIYTRIAFWCIVIIVKDRGEKKGIPLYILSIPSNVTFGFNEKRKKRNEREFHSMVAITLRPGGAPSTPREHHDEALKSQDRGAPRLVCDGGGGGDSPSAAARWDGGTDGVGSYILEKRRRSFWDNTISICWWLCPGDFSALCERHKIFEKEFQLVSSFIWGFKFDLLLECFWDPTFAFDEFFLKVYNLSREISVWNLIVFPTFSTLQRRTTLLLCYVYIYYIFIWNLVWDRDIANQTFEIVSQRDVSKFQYFWGGERITNEGEMILIFVLFSPTVVELSVNSASVAYLSYTRKTKTKTKNKTWRRISHFFSFLFCFLDRSHRSRGKWVVVVVAVYNPPFASHTNTQNVIWHHCLAGFFRSSSDSCSDRPTLSHTHIRGSYWLGKDCKVTFIIIEREGWNGLPLSNGIGNELKLENNNQKRVYRKEGMKESYCYHYVYILYIYIYSWLGSGKWKQNKKGRNIKQLLPWLNFSRFYFVSPWLAAAAVVLGFFSVVVNCVVPMIYSFHDGAERSGRERVRFIVHSFT